MSLNPDQIFEQRSFTIWCFQCNDCTSVESPFPPFLTKSEAGVMYHELGWRHVKSKGYLCPACQKKEEHAECATNQNRT